MRLLHARAHSFWPGHARRKARGSRRHSRGHERQSLPMWSPSKYRGGDCRGGGTMSSPSFQYSRASEVSDAFIQGSRAGTAFVAGGTDLLPLWKAGTMAPEGVVDISRLPLGLVDYVDGQLSLGALARLSDVAAQ